MASAGTQLKQKLGLDAYNSVMVSRVINYPLKMYFVWYDSLTSIPLTQQRILKRHRPATLIQGLKLRAAGKVTHPRLTPPVPVEYFNGVLQDSYFIVVDMGGDWLPRGKKTTVKYESTETPEMVIDLDERAPIFIELDEELKHTGFTVWDFANQAPSDKNKFWYQMRKGQGRTGSYIKEAYLKNNDVGKALVLKFRVSPTFGDSAAGHKTVSRRVKTVDLGSHVRWSSYYTVWVLFEALEDYLSESELDDLRGDNRNRRQQAIRTIFRKGTAKVHSNDMSFYWQGVWENADKLGFSIFPFTGRHGHGVWSRRHKQEDPAIYITKHILEVMKVLPFNANVVARMMTVKEGSHGTNQPNRPARSGDAETADVG